VTRGRKNYAYRIVIARTLEKKTVCNVRRITLNYTAAQLDNFCSTWDMILGADDKDVITFRTARRIKRKMRKWKVSGLPGTDPIVIVSHLEEKGYEDHFINAFG
jgi:hypothetical protein